MSVPDYALGETIDFKFTTRAHATSSPSSLTGGAVQIYVDNNPTPITAGITLSADFATVTGLNSLRVVATSGNGFAAGSSYACVISAGTVDGVSVVGEVVAQFSLDKSSALKPTVAGRALNVAADGDIGGNVDGNVDGSAASVTGAVGSVTGAVGSVTAAVDFTPGSVQAEALAALSDAVAEDYPPTNGNASVGQLLYFLNQWAQAFGWTGTAGLGLRRDQTTPAFDLANDNASNPTTVSGYIKR